MQNENGGKRIAREKVVRSTKLLQQMERCCFLFEPFSVFVSEREKVVG